MLPISTALFCLSSLVLLSCSAVEQEGFQSPEACLGVSGSLLDPRVLFARDPMALEGVCEQDQTSLLQSALSGGKDQVAIVNGLLLGLNGMQDPYVSESAAELIAGILEEERDRMVSGMCIDELCRIFNCGEKLTGFRFMYDMRLLRSAPVMRHCLLRSFYRIVVRVSDWELRHRLMAGHLATVSSESGEKEDLRCIFSCAILEAVRSTTLLSDLRKSLYSSSSRVIIDLGHQFHERIDGTRTFALFLKALSLYLELEPAAGNAVMLQDKIDWKQVFRLYQVSSSSFSLDRVPEYARLSLPIDSDDPEIKEVFEKASVDEFLYAAICLLFRHTWYSPTAMLADIRPGIRRYVNYLWGHGKRLWAQTLAVAVCWLYSMDSWEGEAGWKAERWPECVSRGMTGTDQVTGFHRLPREILLKIGPVMPVLVSKATYQLADLRASPSNLSVFMGRVFRPFDANTTRHIGLLHTGWVPGLSRDEAARASTRIAMSHVDWIDRICEVVDFEEEGSAELARQGRISREKSDYVMDPTDKIFPLIFSLVFGIAPFEHLSPNERLDLVSAVRSRYPRFVSQVQALEALTRRERGDKLCHANALVQHWKWYEWYEKLFYEWLFTRFFAEAELFDLIRTCNIECPFWEAVLAVCRSTSSWLIPMSALKRCVWIVKQGLLGHGIEKAKARAMALTLGIPEALVHSMLDEGHDLLSALLPGFGAEPGSSLGARADSIPADKAFRICFILMNFSDDEIVAILKHRGGALDHNNLDALACCLSLPAKNEVIRTVARNPSSFDYSVTCAVLKTDRCASDGWEPDRMMFGGELFKETSYKQFIEADKRKISVWRARFDESTPWPYRREFFLFSALCSRTRSLAQSRIHCCTDVVFTMLVGGRTIGSIGKSLYLLANGDLSKVETSLSRSQVKQECRERIRMAVVEFEKGPGKVTDGKGLAQQHRFIESFDFAIAEQGMSACFRAYRDILKSLAAAEDSGPTITIFGLKIVYFDGEVVASVAVSRDLPPVYLFKVALKAVKEPFELVMDVDRLCGAGTIGELGLHDAITVRVVNDPKVIVSQLKVIFRLILQDRKQ